LGRDGTIGDRPHYVIAGAVIETIATIEVPFAEIAGALCVCPVHLERMSMQPVPINTAYGTSRQNTCARGTALPIRQRHRPRPRRP